MQVKGSQTAVWHKSLASIAVSGVSGPGRFMELGSVPVAGRVRILTATVGAVSSGPWMGLLVDLEETAGVDTGVATNGAIRAAGKGRSRRNHARECDRPVRE